MEGVATPQIKSYHLLSCLISIRLSITTVDACLSRKATFCFNKMVVVLLGSSTFSLSDLLIDAKEQVPALVILEDIEPLVMVVESYWERW